MALRGWVCGLALGVAASAIGAPALAQQATNCPPSLNHPADGPFSRISDGLVRGPCAEASLPPATPTPVPSPPPSDGAPPAGVPIVADLQVAGTALGFERGIAPAPGLTVAYQGQEYLVVEVTALGGGPTFSGGSRFVITSRGGSLDVGLRAVERLDRQVAAAPLR